MCAITVPGLRYLHRALCAAEWHMVRAQCTRCAGSGGSIDYQPATLDSDVSSGSTRESPVSAETCDECHGYRKIVYQEKDPTVDPVADDLATLNLDQLLDARGYLRLSGNPLLWKPHD